MGEFCSRNFLATAGVLATPQWCKIVTTQGFGLGAQWRQCSYSEGEGGGCSIHWSQFAHDSVDDAACGAPGKEIGERSVARPGTL